MAQTTKILETLTTRFREWYDLYRPHLVIMNVLSDFDPITKTQMFKNEYKTLVCSPFYIQHLNSFLSSVDFKGSTGGSSVKKVKTKDGYFNVNHAHPVSNWTYTTQLNMYPRKGERVLMYIEGSTYYVLAVMA